VQLLVNSLVVGGAERVIEALCRDLPQHDVDVRIGCLRERGPIGRSLAEAGLEVVENLAPARRSAAQLWSLRRFLRRQRPHVMYALEHSNVLLYGRLAARWAGVRSQVMAVHRTGRADGSPSLGRVDRLLMGLSDKVIAVSRGQATYLHQEEGVDARKLEVIHNGVDPSRFGEPLQGEDRAVRRRKLGLPEDAPIVAIVAALRPEKNHRLLLEAMTRLPSASRPHLAVVGDGALAGELRHATAELALQPWVHWLGGCDDVPSVLAAVDLLALASHPRVETFPMCVLEAMAAKLPVVSTDVGSVGEMLLPERTGLLVPPGNPAQLAEAITRILELPDRGRAWGEAGRRRVEAQFTRAEMVERTAKLLWELARRHGQVLAAT
jgi:glycosyltransferase involved in cell wall biosynthesis